MQYSSVLGLVISPWSRAKQCNAAGMIQLSCMTFCHILIAAKFFGRCRNTDILIDITLIAPPSSAPAIKAALKTNPHLTGLPLPKPDLLAPKDLEQNTGTAEIFRLPEVRALVTGDFVVLPCDLVCELGGESLLESWMIREGGLGGATRHEVTGPKMNLGGEKGGSRGGLGVWYETKGEMIIKGEETDFIATTPIEAGPVPPSKSSLLTHVSKLVYSVPTDTLNDITEDKKSLPIRHSLIRAHSRIRMLSSYRDAHIYIFPAWVMDMINSNEHMDSIGEDVIGWWAKAGWQDGLGKKLSLDKIFTTSLPVESEENMTHDDKQHEAIDFASLSLSTTHTSSLEDGETDRVKDARVVPPILAYIHPKNAKLIRRVDTAPLLLSVSLQLAKLDPAGAVGHDASSPFAHEAKVAYTQGIASKTTITRPDCLLAENVTVDEKCSIKECVIGANCQIKQGAKLIRCLLMDGVVVGKGCKLTGCIVGKRAEIGDDSVLTDCEVQENLLVEPESKSSHRLTSLLP